MSNYPPISPLISVEDGTNKPVVRPSKPFGGMKPLHTTSPFRSQKVGSSTCPKPQTSQDGAVAGLADEMAQDCVSHLSGPEHHILTMVEEGSISLDQAYDAIEQL